MASDRVAILTDDEEDQKRRYVLEGPFETPAPALPEVKEAPPPAASAPPPSPAPAAPRRLCGSIDERLLISKIFYFSFYSAFGSLYPLLPVYFKQLGMVPSQGGLVLGVRYFVEFCSAPFWGVVADRFDKGKAVLLFSVLCWVAFTCGLGFVRPAEMACVAEGAWSDPQANSSAGANHTRGRGYPGAEVFLSPGSPGRHGVYSNGSTATGAAPVVVYDEDQVEVIFLIILLIVLCGEFFSAPTMTIVDTVTLKYLGNQRDRYGLQRMWGSLGWGIAMLLVGIWIDHTHVTPVVEGAGCTPPDFKNYRIAFIAFGALMTATLAVATLFRFEPRPVTDPGNRPATDMETPGVAQGASGSGAGGVSTGSAPPPSSYMDLVRLLCGVRYGSVLFVAWAMGFGYGFVFTFLYWYLQDLNGTTTLFGVCSVLSHVSELATYLVCHKFIQLVGHIRVLYIGLACNTARYLYISYIENAWLVLPMEFLQGLTHASVWAACISYVSAAVPPALKTSAQGILHGLHLGLGRGCGAMVGGVFVNVFGAAETFRGLGMAFLLILLVFALIQTFICQEDAKRDSGSAQDITVPTGQVPAGQVPAGQVQSQVGSEHVMPTKKSKHQEEQEDVSKPAWVVPTSPWVSITLALCQMKEMIRFAESSFTTEQDTQTTTEPTSAGPPAADVPSPSITASSSGSASDPDPDRTVSHPTVSHPTQDPDLHRLQEPTDSTPDQPEASGGSER